MTMTKSKSGDATDRTAFAGSVSWTREMKTKLYLLVNAPMWRGWANVSGIISKQNNVSVSASSCRSAWARYWG